VNSDEIRAVFLGFFEEKGHKIIPSSSLIPRDDPTLLLTSAGMVQFKPYFLGEVLPPSRRLASCQKCFRTTDIASVGDPGHLTFFEMLGNFSIGDYFKREAISWAWEFVTQRLGLSPERLWVTIFLDDDESFRIWREVGVPEERLLRFGEEDNFWGPAGDSGPCGPCSEIHYDFGEKVGCGKPSCRPNCDCGRFSEIWNLVFTQYNQDKDGHRTLLPKPNIDTGMGLERTAAVVQGKTSVYETDLFSPLLECVSELAGKKYGSDDAVDNAMRVIAEHSRGLAFLIADGVIPSNEGRGYVLRRVLRRTALFGRRLGLDKPFIGEVARATIEQMGHIYPEIVQRRDFILQVIENEEEKFGRTLDEGLQILEDEIMPIKQGHQQQMEKLSKDIAWVLGSSMPLPNLVQNIVTRIRDMRNKSYKDIAKISHARLVMLHTVKSWDKALDNLIAKLSKLSQSSRLNQKQLGKFTEGKIKKIQESQSVISGEEAFILYDTYGFPVELTQEIAADHGFSVDLAGFEKEMEKQRERARKVGKELTISWKVEEAKHRGIESTPFVGYHKLTHKSVILELSVDNESVETIKEGQEASLILESTPFYAEMGGQVGDTGEIRGSTGRFLVTNTVRIPPGIIVHQGKVVEGYLLAGDEVEAEVDRERRLDIARNHTATHLLQSALRQVLGEHVQQRGSLVAPDRLRFDFSHLTALTNEEIEQVNRIVNERIRQNLRVYDEDIPYKKAIEEGAIALFDEKYGDVVRVVKIGEPRVSAELCGGTHVASTGEIGFFYIISESSIGAGLRRIEAVTSRGAEAYINQRLSDLQHIAQSLGASSEEARDKVSSLVTELESERRRSLALERELAKKIAESLLAQAEVINGVTVLAARVPSLRMQSMREMSDFLRDRLKSAVVVLGTVYEDKPAFLAAVTPDLVARGYDAGEIVRQVARVTGGSGGGKPGLGQAGGKYKDKLDDALLLVKSLI
jgi:alanyl-tRNA synthetase